MGKWNCNPGTGSHGPFRPLVHHCQWKTDLKLQSECTQFANCQQGCLKPWCSPTGGGLFIQAFTLSSHLCSCSLSLTLSLPPLNSRCVQCLSLQVLTPSFLLTPPWLHTCSFLSPGTILRQTPQIWLSRKSFPVILSKRNHLVLFI